jgi:alanyl-tRNA synthetase
MDFFTVDQLRSKFLKFFESKGHTVYPSDSLVPENDPSLLFTGAGMNQFKDMFLGKGRLPFSRAATCQKCFRTGDIDRVGRTPAHQTFFEMLGNFSFGDYFKAEVIPWAWEFLLSELKIPAEKLSVSVYEDDQEAYDIWLNKIGIPAERIYRFDAKDNFWPANAPKDGPNGPCGPCSEIFYDFGKERGCNDPGCNPSCNCGRFVEIWNLVFTQFDRQPDGSLEPLPKKNIDTGMGLERLAAVIQGVHSNFDIDVFVPIVKRVAELLDVEYSAGSEEGARIRRIADHVRGITFTICDGVAPSNEKQGYVLRKILRIALRDAMKLGKKETLLWKLVPTVIEVMKAQYPELEQRREHIVRVIKIEEEKFLEVVDEGTQILDRAMQELSAKGEKALPGEDAFRLYDTYGFPIDITQQILAEKGFTVDLRGFEQAMEKQRLAARAGTKMSGQIFDTGPLLHIKGTFNPTEFLGYEKLDCHAKVLAILKGEKFVESIDAQADITVLLDKTAFYGESGGQVGDTGKMTAEGVELAVTDCKRVESYFLHVCKLKKGTLKTGMDVHAAVDGHRREAVARAHTTTHLLQNALRTVLGKHVEQAGSFVEPDSFRFDFTHTGGMTQDELRRVQEFVNEKIVDNAPVKVVETSLDQAKKDGTLAFFGEKYGEKVRMVSVGDYSKELCGGTHLKRAGSAGYFRIVSESSVASGTRRIEAQTGLLAVKQAMANVESLKRLSETLGQPADRLMDGVKALQEQIKDLKGKLAQGSRQGAQEVAAKLMSSGKNIGGVCVIAAKLGEENFDELRGVNDFIRKQGMPYAALLCSVCEGKVNMIAALSQDVAAKGLDAVALIRAGASVVGGGGGGKKELAQAGGREPEKLDDALKAFEQACDKALGAVNGEQEAAG